MIDKLDLRLPSLTQFRQEPREFMLESQYFRNSTRTMPSGRYEWATDFRPIGIDARLNYSLKRNEDQPHKGEHKLELIDTGVKSFSQLSALVEQVVEGPIDDLELMRIDLCADICEVPVVWFLDRTRVKYKRVAYEMGNLKYQKIGTIGIQTISAGRRPNIVRIYDKIAEYKVQLDKLNRKRSIDSDPLTLKSEFGVSESATITRVERQFGGGRLPDGVGCFGKLARLPDYDPFKNIEIVNGSAAYVPTVKECGFDTWVTGTRLRELQDQMGLQQFRRWLNAHSQGNAARYRKKYSPFLESGLDKRVTSETLFEVYRESVTKQLAA